MSTRRRIGFLIYVGRSGSTLLASLLDSYDDIDVLPETHVLTRIINNPNTSFDTERLEKLVEDFYSEKQFNDLKVPFEFLMASFSKYETPLSKETIVSQLIESLCDFLNFSAPILIIKTSPYKISTVIYNYFVINIFFIHLVRDLRAIHRSRLETFNRYPRSNPGDSLLFCSYHWNTHVSCFKNMKNVHELRYEDLVINSPEELSRIRAFLSLENRKIGQVKKYKVGLSQKHLHKNIGTDIDKSFATKWKNQLLPEEILVLTIFGKKLLKRFNYPIDLRFSFRTYFKFIIVVFKDLCRLTEVIFLKFLKGLRISVFKV